VDQRLEHRDAVVRGFDHISPGVAQNSTEHALSASCGLE
jgi:hypothetical protein